MIMADTEKRAIRNKRRFLGEVTSIAGDKSVVVEVRRKVQHRTYRKYVIRRKRYMAHDEKGVCGLGDQVRIEECRPISARKRWRVVELVERSEGVA